MLCETVRKLLQLSGASSGSRLHGITWRLEQAYSPLQHNGDDCGLFTIRNGVAVVRDENIGNLKYDGYALRLDYAVLLRDTLLASKEQVVSQKNVSYALFATLPPHISTSTVLLQEDQHKQLRNRSLIRCGQWF